MKPIPVRHLTDSVQKPAIGHFQIRKLDFDFFGPDRAQPTHRHNFYFLLFIIQGSGKHTIDLKAYNVVDKSLFFLRPGQVHSLTLNTESRGYIVQFDFPFVDSSYDTMKHLLREVTHLNFCALNELSFGKLENTLQLIFQEYQESREKFLESIDALLQVFLIELIRNRNLGMGSRHQSSSYAQDRLYEFLELLEQKITTVKQVNQYADLMNLSVYQLNKILKDNLDKTCMQMISEQLIVESKRYLLASSNRVKDIAHLLGFEDLSYFVRFFKKHTGFTPEAFREKFGNVQ
ncbi:helix-turn-helix domain-containing protein [Marinoscillum sp.]|uniref:helix-turn-helix domain-containing protein n=1 Tax=Marinoscillum sp. TaxID=2024838 RepID=UPI003BADBB21